MRVPTVHYLKQVQEINLFPARGRICQAVGIALEGFVPNCVVGDVCEIDALNNKLLAEVVGFRDDKALLMPLSELIGVGPGSTVVNQGAKAAQAPVSESLLGRVLNGLGDPIDGLGPIEAEDFYPLYAAPPSHLERQRITEPLDVGIRSINGLLTIGRGQRMGIFSGSGVGKSVLLGMMARYTAADVNVIALIGERGREVKEFIERDLTREGLKRSVVIVATSDQPPLVRRRGAFLAMAIAEYFRDRHQHILFMMDSLTRLAHVQREIGLAVGEPPTTKGYTPSVFALLPKFLERAGTTPHTGSITGIYSVLVDGDDLNDPIPDAARAILDGHVVLSRDLAIQNQYPAVDVLASISRVMVDIVTPSQMEHARRFSDLLATYRKAEDLIHIGAYKPGSSIHVDEAIAKWENLQSYLKQGINDSASFKDSVEAVGRAVATIPPRAPGIEFERRQVPAPRDDGVL
ncbi:MAG: FliI/YscN family ATPase [Nitrospirae bacterium]|nr:FliI/YscN family ATPase [Candidatus Troglogloeales bacterium]